MRAELVVAALFVAGAWAGCPNITPVESLDLKNFMGTWYQNASLGTLFIHGLDKCVSSDYQLADDGKTVTIVNDRIAKGVQEHLKSTWTAVASNPSKPNGEFTLTLHIPVLKKETQVPLLVLATDYTNYAVLYACKSFAFFNFKAGYIFTRKRSYTANELASFDNAIENALNKNGLKRSKFSLTSQDGCDSSAGTVDANSLLSSVASKITGR